MNIEKRRSLGAGYYFFSFRRMFGAIELTRKENSKLAEKAGREGFQENKAYRDLKDILENFFIQVAADFFRKKGKYSDTFVENKDQYRLALAREKHEQENRKKSREFESQLDSFFVRINSEKPQEEITVIIESLLKRIESASQKKDEISLLDAEIKAVRELDALKNEYKIDLPQGIGLTRQLKRDWYSYSVEFGRLEIEVFNPAETKISNIISKVTMELKFALDQKKRVELLVNEVIIEARDSTQLNIKTTQNTFNDLQVRFQTLVQEINVNLQDTVKRIQDDVEALDVSNKNRETVEGYRHIWEHRVSTEAKKHIEVLTHIRTQLENINWFRDENGYLIGNAEITAALEDEVLALRERVDADAELAQLGMALDIINHEFSNTVRSIRKNLELLRAWAESNQMLTQVYNDLNNSFTHLDGYLTLFTPLNRRLYKSKIEITGSSIANYLNDLFKERLLRHEVELKSTSKFRNMTVVGFPSTFYPVFINLVDNAIFWLKDRPLPRTITLDAKEQDFIVSDNGPGVPRRDRENIFELGFTRKPGGRGMGLYISREVLKREGYQIYLPDLSIDSGATFVISPVSS